MGLDISHYIPSSVIQLEYFTKAELMCNVSYVEKYKDMFIVNSDGIEILYVEQVGYQRKRMSPGFYDTFVNNKPYFTLSDVEKAGSFLSPLDEPLEELKKTFATNFLNSFTEGKSIFTANW